MIRTFEIPGQPQGKGRARCFSRGGHASMYTPDTTISYENHVKMQYQALHGVTATSAPIKMEIHAYFRMPQSWSKKKRSAVLDGKVFATVKPDVDNIAKIIGDALNGIAYLDDKQIVTSVVYKEYGTLPRVEVKIEELGE